MLFEHILVTTDLSEDSYTAFDLAAYQASFNNSRITLLSVFEDFTLPLALRKDAIDADTMKAARAEYRSEITGQIEKLAKERFHRFEVTPKVIFSDKNPAEEIIAFADDELVNLIVIATHGKGAVPSLVLGGTTQRVLRKAPCPVMVIPKL